MKRVLITLLLFLSIISGCSSSKSKNEIINRFNLSEWSKSEGGIQAQLFTYKQNYKPGENIEIGIALKNVTGKDFILSKSPYITINMSYNGNGYADAIGEKKINDEDIKIPPRKTKELKLITVSTSLGEGLYEFTGGMDNINFPKLEVKVEK